MSPKSKKGRNPGAVDNWLESIGLYRKNVAYDETCLFRAVSEQLFDCQIYHERVRKECVEYGRDHCYEFLDVLDNECDWYSHLDLLEKHMVVCGHVEIQLIGRKYNRDVFVFDAARQQMRDATEQRTGKALMLCLMNEDHYDAVYKREYIEEAGFCQSLVYGILYEKVFNVTNVNEIVQGMLYEKEFSSLTFDDDEEVNNNLVDPTIVKKEHGSSKHDGFSTLAAPFPFKVAKALDPTIYRNIEYDSWTEVRRELRLGDWYYGDDNLILGTRCILNDEDDTYECYIQDIIKDENKCVVYVTRLAEKRTVNYSDLSPEDDAKPWPLPYRFSKNLVVSGDNTSSERGLLKTPKKRRFKRRDKSASESSVLQMTPVTPSTAQHKEDINDFVGIPLVKSTNPHHRKHALCDDNNYSQVNSIHANTNKNHQYSQTNTAPSTPATPATITQSQHNLLITPDAPSPMPRFSWDTPPNLNPFAMPITSNQIVWSPGTPNVFNLKPMIASAPVTPNVVPYHDTTYPFVVNYHVENYNPWNLDYNQNQQMMTAHQEQINEQVNIEQTDQNNTTYCTYEETVICNSPNVQRERPTLCTSMSSPSPQVEVFSPMIPMHPGTPVIYASPPEGTMEVMMPGGGPSLQVFTPPVETVQYMSTNPFVFPPPSQGNLWYPPGINAQGFIFPAPYNQ